MFCMKRKVRYIILSLFACTVILWLINTNVLNKEENSRVEYVRMRDDIDLGNPMVPLAANDAYRYSYNNQLPLIFIGGVPRSGTTLMRAMVDAHPLIRCGEETRVLPRVIFMRNQWMTNPKEAERLKSAGIDDHIIDAAITSFILEVIVRHGKPAPHLCNKDPLILRYSNYVSKLFPNSKFVLMIRDGRATVHSIITRKVTITGFNLNSYRDCLAKWNQIIESMLTQCMMLGSETCLPVYYEQLVLHPESQMRSILKFLNVSWDDAVLHHEEHIGKEISISKTERSSDQVIKPVNMNALASWVGKIPDDVIRDMDQIAPMLRKLGYDPNANPPNYGSPDEKIKENTFNVDKNHEYWNKLAKQYSIHVTDKI